MSILAPIWRTRSMNVGMWDRFGLMNGFRGLFQEERTSGL